MGQVFAFATPDWIMSSHWKTVLLYAKRAGREMAIRAAIRKAQYGIDEQALDATNGDVSKFGRLGKVTRGASR